MNILVISSNFTGHGHKSIAESLVERFYINEQTEVHVIDGFLLGGEVLLRMGKLYGPVTRHAEYAWKWIWNFSSKKSIAINSLIQRSIEKRFLQIINEVKPDCIVTIHPNFNGSIINILEKYEISIPFITLIADLISISSFWVDHRADYIISPTFEAKERCVQFGVNEEKIHVLGFPVRSQFTNALLTKKLIRSNGKEPLHCLMMSGGEGVGNMREMAELLMSDFNCNVTIMTGRNETLRKKLEKTLRPRFGERIQIQGYTTNVHEFMHKADLLIARGSPNVMMEAVACNVPLVIIGALPGQEEENPLFAEKYGLAVSSYSREDLRRTLSDLFANNEEKLIQIKRAQQNFSHQLTPHRIVEFLCQLAQKTNV